MQLFLEESSAGETAGAAFKMAQVRSMRTYGGSDRLTMSTVTRHFEGRARLDHLLTSCGSLADSESVAYAFTQAQKDGVPASVVIDALFEDEPRFSRRDEAPALFGNLLGLWDLLERGVEVDLTAPAERRAAESLPALPPPPRYAKEGPTAEWLNQAFAYWESCSERERTRLHDAFENRLNNLVTWLESQADEDVVYGTAYDVLFELFVLLELGAPNGVKRVDVPAEQNEIPKTLATWAEEAVFQGATDEEEPMSNAVTQQLQRLTNEGLQALWQGVKHGF
jgi:hypothetical protein